MPSNSKSKITLCPEQPCSTICVFITRHTYFLLWFPFQELIDVNQGLLSALGVSHPALEQIINIAAKQKMHAKLTGAGGGGFVYALITPWHTEIQINAAKLELESAGFLCWEAQLAGDGVKHKLTWFWINFYVLFSVVKVHIIFLDIPRYFEF